MLKKRRRLSSSQRPVVQKGRCTLHMSRFKRPLIGVVWKLERGVPAQVSSSSQAWFKITRSVINSPCVAG
ncbi:hypothetical protein TNCV_1458181 [Trichonephila clavipes]|nr:hypothetical protein TNCV_1458181 [Trichonephila clavipes]